MFHLGTAVMASLLVMMEVLVIPTSKSVSAFVVHHPGFSPSTFQQSLHRTILTPPPTTTTESIFIQMRKSAIPSHADIYDKINYVLLSGVLLNTLYSIGGFTNIIKMLKSLTPTTVLKCSVALEVSNRDDSNSIFSVLDRMTKVMAKTCDTQKGVVTESLTKQVALELLRRKSSIYSASGIVQQYIFINKNNDAQRTFDQWSVQERSKSEQEIGNMFGKFDSSLEERNHNEDDSTLTSSSNATMAVVTLVVSASGLNVNNSNNNKIKTIRSLSDLESILQSIASMNSSEMDDALYRVVILWTPKDRSETMTKQDVIVDYPELNTYEIYV